MNRRIAALVSAILLASACETTAPVENDVQDQTECQGFVTNWGSIPWTTEGKSATYEHDFETSRFTINVETPSDFRIQVTQKGTNRHLDLVMAVYDADGNKVGSDDDSGWGRNPLVDVSAETIGEYEVRVDPKLPETEGGEIEFVRGKYRVELTCMSDLCDVTAAQDFKAIDMPEALDTLLATTENLPQECGDNDYDEYMCTSKTSYGVRYSFNPALAPSITEAADIIENDEYMDGYFGTSVTRLDFSSDLSDFNLNIDDVDAILGYSDYEIGALEIESDCSPDYCWGNWWFLHSPERGETFAIQLGYYQSNE